MQKREQGFTLIELLISVTIALIISAAIFGIYANSAGTSAAMLKSSKLNQELYSLMLVMSNDIRRAGYWVPSDLADLETPHDNPFSKDTTQLTLITNDSKRIPDDSTSPPTTGNVSTETSCIVYSFDENEDGILTSNEIYGFRLNGGAVEMLEIAGNAVIDTDECGTGTGNTWQPVTDSNLIRITKLSFSRSGSECVYANFPSVDCYSTPPSSYMSTLDPAYKEFVDSLYTVETRQLNISLAGELINDSSVKASMEQDVRVRNDRVKEWPIP
jgi:type IV pilus assembly protein PilW